MVGCSTPAPVAQYQMHPDINIESYKTFALLPIPKDLPGADPAVLLRYGNTALEGMRASMVAKGYVESDLDSADLVINLKGAVVPTIIVQQQHGVNYGYYAQSSFWGSHYPSMTFGVTTDLEKDAVDYANLVLEIYESGSKELVWVGWMTTIRSNQQVEHEVVKARIAQILESFPQGNIQ